MNKITTDDIEKVKDLYEKHESAQKEAKQMYNRLREKRKDEMIEREDNDGNMQEIRLYDCLEEASGLGWDSPAGEAIAKEYPKMKELYEEQSELKSKITEFVNGEMGINPFKVTIKDIIKVAEAVYKAQEK